MTYKSLQELQALIDNTERRLLSAILELIPAKAPDAEACARIILQWAYAISENHDLVADSECIAQLAEPYGFTEADIPREKVSELWALMLASLDAIYACVIDHCKHAHELTGKGASAVRH